MALPQVKLPDSVLAKTNLPIKPSAVILEGKIVSLRPLNIDQDSAQLYQVSNGSSFQILGRIQNEYDPNELIWKYLFYGPFTNLTDFQKYLSDLSALPNMQVFTVFEKVSNHPIGILALMNNEPKHLKIEIGMIWYSPIGQRTGANYESCYLLLDHLFALGYRRAEWKCNARNLRSWNSALKIGFTFEYVQDCHMIIKGVNCNTAWFRILDSEWTEIKAKLEQKMYPAIE